MKYLIENDFYDATISLESRLIFYDLCILDV